MRQLIPELPVLHSNIARLILNHPRVFWKRHSLMEDSTGSKVFTSPKGWEPRSVCLRWLITVFMHSCHCYASIFITVLSRSKHDIWQSFCSTKWEQWITLNIVADCMGSFRHYFKRNVHHSCIYAATLFQCQIYIPSLISGANSKKYKVDTVEPSYYGR